jgi:hypothetical protein
MSDAFDQKLRAADYQRGLPSVSFGLAIPLGPRSMKAGVSLAYEGQYPLEFKSTAVWPDADNSEAAVRAGMLDVLLKDEKPVIGGIFTLVAIEYDLVHSSDMAFRLAAREATRSLLSILVRGENGPNQTAHPTTL